MLTRMVLIICSCAAFGQKQTVLDQKVSVRFDNETVTDALEKLGLENGLVLNYYTPDIPKDRKISKRYRNQRLSEVIRDIWGNDKLTLRAQGNTIDLQSVTNNEIAANADISGIINDTNRTSLPGATVQLTGTRFGAITDSNGAFRLAAVPNGTYTLTVSSVGFERYERRIEIYRNPIQLSISLTESIDELEEVVVTGKSITQQRMEEPIKIDIINTAKLQAQSISIPQIINQTSGVNVRQVGGVGSGTLININGLQGDAIRFFRDDIPLDYLGRAFDLGLVPVGQLEGIEIYKGILPVSLGADALGGAVNFKSREFYENQLDLSYSYGSFNTHQANLAGYWQIPNSSFFTQISSYYVNSDNNYKQIAPVIDDDLGIEIDREVERFHDGIESRFIELKTGIRDKDFADLLEVGFANFDYDKENQNGQTISSPLGQSKTQESFSAFTARYKKTIDRLSLDIFGALSRKQTLFVDTTKRVYNWLGEFVIPDGGDSGESGAGNLTDLDFDQEVVRAQAGYNLNGLLLTLSHNYTNEERVGTDPFAVPVQFEGADVDVLSIPSVYQKNVSGIELERKFLKDKLTIIVTAKRYELATTAYSNNVALGTGMSSVNTESYGFGLSQKYALTEDHFVRVSYERATRIPSSEEYFGDGRFVLANPFLTPEESDNLNLGFEGTISDRFSLGVNSFYRKVRDQVVLQPIFFFFSRNQNLDNARILGSEVTFKAKILQGFQGIFNVTYTDARRIDIELFNQQLNEEARLPYRPYFFTNLNLNYTREGLFAKNDQFQAFLNHSFTEKYIFSQIPRSQEPGLFENLSKSNISNLEDSLIPTQNVVDVGCTYKFGGMPLWINVEVVNLTNAELFDVFLIPKPGRNYRLKLRYLLTKN